MPNSRFQSLKPQHSLRRLRTAFTNSERSPSTTSLSSSSPLSATTDGSFKDLTGMTFSNASTTNLPYTSTTFPQQSQCMTGNCSAPITDAAYKSCDPSTWDYPVPSQLRQSSRRVIRKKKSTVELQQAEERECIRGELLGLVEPRPGAGVALGTIEEVLQGRA